MVSSGFVVGRPLAPLTHSIDFSIVFAKNLFNFGGGADATINNTTCVSFCEFFHYRHISGRNCLLLTSVSGCKYSYKIHRWESYAPLRNSSLHVFKQDSYLFDNLQDITGRTNQLPRSKRCRKRKANKQKKCAIRYLADERVFMVQRVNETVVLLKHLLDEG